MMMKKDVLGGILFAAVIVVVICLVTNCITGDFEPINISGVAGEEGIIVYNRVNFRSSPSSENDTNDIGDFYYGENVKVLEHNVNGWSKVMDKTGKTGYITSEAVSPYRMIIDISDYNWGRDKEKAIDWVETLAERAKSTLKLGGFYVQVSRTEHVDRFWVDIVKVLEEKGIPYGLYFYTPAKTQETAKAHYELFKSEVDAQELKLNKLPIMIDLEKVGNQSEALKFMNTVEDDYLVYANTTSMRDYKYYELADTIWIAHYDICQVFPTMHHSDYTSSYEMLAEKSVMWQFTQSGNAALLKTSSLDISIVQDEEWYSKYVK